MTDQYDWWRKALKIGSGRELTREQLETLGVSETDPQPGFYRRRSRKDGPYVPVAIWRDESGELICLAEGRQVSPDYIDQLWTWTCRWPISEELYHKVANGGEWPDEPPAPIGHNQQKTGDPCKDLRAEFVAEKELADEFLKKPIETQEQADRAATWSKRIASIAKKATEHHATEKRPHLDECNRVDNKWRDLKEHPAALAKRLKRHMDDFLNEQRRKDEERRRKARDEAERKQREADEIARKAQQSEDPAAREAAERAAAEAAEAERETKERNASAGRTGARVSLRTYYEAHITDYDALVMALKDEPEIREVVEKIANRIARTKGATMPAGSERVEDRRAA